MESLKIILVCIAAAIFYGIVHDQFTARICVEYLPVFRPPVFGTQSPTLLGIRWGIIATWWVGAILGILLALAARAGSRSKLFASVLLTPIAKLLFVMATCAVVSGLTRFLLASRGFIAPPMWVATSLAPSAYPRFMADWWAHNASHAVGFFSGIGMCIAKYQSRIPRHT